MPPSPLSPVDNGSSIMSTLAHAAAKPARSMSTSSGGSYSSEPSTPSSLYPKAPGSERSERSGSREDEHQVGRKIFLHLILLLPKVPFLKTVKLFQKISIYYIKK